MSACVCSDITPHLTTLPHLRSWFCLRVLETTTLNYINRTILLRVATLPGLVAALSRGRILSG